MPIAFLQSMPDEEHQSENHPPVRPRRSFAVIFPLVVLAGLGLWFWNNHGTSSAHANDIPAARSTLHLDTFVLNLADADRRSYLRVGIELRLNQETKHAEEAVPIAQVRDTILSVLGEAKVPDLLTSSGKTKLKQDLLLALQEKVPKLGVEQVYFTEFLIQL